jgi:hypothetical protein
MMQIKLKLSGELSELQDIISVLHLRATGIMVQRTADADAAEAAMGAAEQITKRHRRPQAFHERFNPEDLPVVVQGLEEPILTTAPGSAPPANVAGVVVALDPLLAGSSEPPAVVEPVQEAAAATVVDPLLAPSPAAPVEEPSPIPDNDKLWDLANNFVAKHGQKGSIALGNMVRNVFGKPQISAIPNEQRLEFVAKLQELTVG